MSTNSKMDVFKNWYIHPVETSAAMRASTLQSCEPTRLMLKHRVEQVNINWGGKRQGRKRLPCEWSKWELQQGLVTQKSAGWLLPAVLPATGVRMIKIVDFLGGPWLRIHLPMQGKWVWSLVRKDPTCHGAARPVCHNSWGLPTAEPVLHSKGSHN